MTNDQIKQAIPFPWKAIAVTLGILLFAISMATWAIWSETHKTPLPHYKVVCDGDGGFGYTDGWSRIITGYPTMEAARHGLRQHLHRLKHPDAEAAPTPPWYICDQGKSGDKKAVAKKPYDGPPDTYGHCDYEEWHPKKDGPLKGLAVMGMSVNDTPLQCDPDGYLRVCKSCQEATRKEDDARHQLLHALQTRRLTVKELKGVNDGLNVDPFVGYFACVKYAELYDIMTKQWELQTGFTWVGGHLSAALGQYNRCPQEDDNHRELNKLIDTVKELAQKNEPKSGQVEQSLGAGQGTVWVDPPEQPKDKSLHDETGSGDITLDPQWPHDKEDVKRQLPSLFYDKDTDVWKVKPSPTPKTSKSNTPA